MMKQKLFVILYLCFLATVSQGQNKFGVDQCTLSFLSDGVIEDIKADNTKVTSIFDAAKGDIAFLARIKDFEFEKKLMQVHFNEKYLESEKYPKSTFLGTVSGFDASKTGSQQVTARGKLTIHGVTRDVTAPGTMEIKGNMITLKSAFRIKLADYKVTIPQIVWQNIAEEVEIKLNFTYSPI